MRLAILIDAENVDASHFHRIRRDAQALGSVGICRIFGDFTENRLKDWVGIARSNGLQAVMQFSGKNAADISIAVQAMDLVYTKKVDGICLVSSDADFLPVIQWLRGESIEVFGFGEAKTPHAMRKACSDFIELGNAAKPQAQKPAPPKLAQKAA